MEYFVFQKDLSLQTVIIKNMGPVLCLFPNFWRKTPAPTRTNAPPPLFLIPLWLPSNYHRDSLSPMQARTVLQEKQDGLLATFSGFLWCIIQYIDTGNASKTQILSQFTKVHILGQMHLYFDKSSLFWPLYTKLLLVSHKQMIKAILPLLYNNGQH